MKLSPKIEAEIEKRKWGGGELHISSVRELISMALDLELEACAHAIDRECTEVGADAAIRVVRGRIGRERKQ